ncbi:MAG: glycosyltransferase, partial [Thermofilaceae archaeon]
IVSEYSSLSKKSRRLDLLFKIREYCERFGLNYELIHMNISPSLTSQETFKYNNKVKRYLIILRKPAIFFVILKALRDCINLIKETLSKKEKVFIILIGTEYIPSIYLLVIYLILKFTLSITNRGKIIFIYDFVDLYLQTYNYNNFEKVIYNIAELILLNISKIVLASSIIIQKYLEKRIKYYNKKKREIIYFPPSVPIDEIAKISNTINKDHIRQRLGFCKNDIILVYTGNIRKELSGLDILIEALLKIEKNSSYIFEKVKTLLILNIGHITDSDYRKLKYALQQTKFCKKAVKVLINIDRDKVYRLLSISDFGLALLDPTDSISRQMDWPLKVAEYIACGLPIIYTPFGRMSVLVADNVHGFKVNRESVDIVKVYNKIYQLDLNDIIKFKKSITSIRRYIDINSYASIIFQKILNEMRNL